MSIDEGDPMTLSEAQHPESSRSNSSMPEIHPLSFGQRAIWFLQRLAPESPAYNIPVALCVRAALDIEAFHRSFQDMVDRHACLRTTFDASSGTPVQV